MRAAIMEGAGEPLVVREFAEPRPAPHGVLLRIEACGICRSDWHAWVGHWDWLGFRLNYPHILGHELCGIVEETGAEVRRFRKGDRVLVPFSQGEGMCPHCRSGHSNVCEQAVSPGFDYWGGFGRYCAIPHADFNLVPMPETMDFVEGAALGCRYMTAFHGLASTIGVRAGEWVAIQGCGGVGLSAVQIATALGACVVAVDIDDDKLILARGQGAVATLNARAGNAAAAVRDLTKGGADVSVHALGVKATCLAAIGSLRKRGRHLQLGLTGKSERGEIALPIDRIVNEELAIGGGQGMPSAAYGPMLAMIGNGRLAPSSLVSRRLPLDEVPQAIVEMGDFRTMGFTVIDRY
jgi:D-arabinose 1-dehydrogenase-like Zn-dependent alcohol dehydrogenase